MYQWIFVMRWFAIHCRQKDLRPLQPRRPLGHLSSKGFYWWPQWPRRFLRLSVKVWSKGWSVRARGVEGAKSQRNFLLFQMLNSSCESFSYPKILSSAYLLYCYKMTFINCISASLSKTATRGYRIVNPRETSTQHEVSNNTNTVESRFNGQHQNIG